ncbi:MAG: zinc-dependent alcohol dehydrogenase [Candidatus Humimicrobiaceae bacterium]
MKAAVLKGPKDLHIEDVPKPVPGHGEVLIRVRATAICGTDISIFDGKTEVDYPRILGHESSGEIVELGEGVKNLKVGDRIVMNSTSYCGTCLDCMRGETHICKNGGLFGREFDGTFAEYVAVGENGAFILPDTISFTDATTFAVLSTVVHAQRKVHIFPNSSVVVIGEGTSGLMHSKISKLKGADPVIGIDIKESEWKLDLAKSLYGADYVLTENVIEKVYELTGGKGADFVIECVGKGATWNLATELVRPGGKIIAFGITAKTIENFNSYSLYYKDLEIIGSRAMQLIDWPISIDLAKKGKIDIGTFITNRLPLEDLVKGFEMLKDPSQKALRVVIEI